MGRGRGWETNMYEHAGVFKLSTVILWYQWGPPLTQGFGSSRKRLGWNAYFIYKLKCDITSRAVNTAAWQSGRYQERSGQSLLKALIFRGMVKVARRGTRGEQGVRKAETHQGPETVVTNLASRAQWKAPVSLLISKALGPEELNSLE